MPGLPNYSHEPPSVTPNCLESNVTRTHPSARVASINAMANKIKYIPPQMDALASTTTQASRENPLWLLMHDASVLASVLRYLPWTVLPFRTSDKSCELYMGPSSARDLLLQSWLSVLEVAFLIAAIPIGLLLPGMLSVAIAMLCCGVIYVLAWPMQGPRIAYSMMDDETVLSAEQRGSERWLFVNGCATGYDSVNFLHTSKGH